MLPRAVLTTLNRQNRSNIYTVNKPTLTIKQLIYFVVAWGDTIVNIIITALISVQISQISQAAHDNRDDYYNNNNDYDAIPCKGDVEAFFIVILTVCIFDIIMSICFTCGYRCAAKVSKFAFTTCKIISCGMYVITLIWSLYIISQNGNMTCIKETSTYSYACVITLVIILIIRILYIIIMALYEFCCFAICDIKISM